MAKAILIAEDNPNDAVVIRHALSDAGVKNPVVVVRDGDEVIAYLAGDGKFADREQFPLPGVLMLDLKMPRMDGFQVMEWLNTKPELKDVLRIVLSGYDELHHVNRAYQLGARTFLVKPCRVPDIQNLMHAFSGHWETGA